MIGQPFSDAASLANNTQILAHYTAAAITGKDKAVCHCFNFIFFFHRLPSSVFLLFSLAMFDDGFGYQMQGHDKLHLCLLPFFADVLLPIRYRLEMSILPVLHVGNDQAGKASEDKHQPCLFCLLVVYFQSHELGHIVLLQEAYLLFRFLILGILKGITVNESLADRTAQRYIWPTYAFIICLLIWNI